jgi:hypothetical protein
MKKISQALTLAASLFALNSYAATFDFIGYADDGLTDDNGTSYSEGSYDPFVAKESGITLTATAAYDSKKAFAYLDEHDAGLGVCKSNLASCGSDDNVQEKETLILSFDKTVSIGNTYFRNKSHGTYFNGFIQLKVDDVLVDSKLYLAHLLNFSAYQGKKFEFINLSYEDDGKKWYTDDFYISTMSVSAVPVPAAAFLMAPALVGFIGLRRKPSKA